MAIRNQKDFCSGILFIVAGIAFAWGASTYKVGVGANMGPGYFPLILGVALAVLGSVIALQAVVAKSKNGEKIGTFAWKPLFFIILANLVFGICIGGLDAIGLPPLGLIIGIFALTFIAAYAGDEFRVREAFVLAIILSTLSYFAFVKFLNLQFPVWPDFINF